MEITDVKIFLRNEEKLKAYATITLDDCFIVRDVKVIQGSNGLFIAMPSRKKPDGTYKDIAHPLNNETRKKIEDKVLEFYKKELENPTKPEMRSSTPSFSTPSSNAMDNAGNLEQDINKSIEDKFSV